MDPLIEKRAQALGMAFETTRVVFDLGRENKGVADALNAQTPVVASNLEAIRRRIPLPHNAGTGMESHFYRLPNHNRSFCFSLAETDAFFDAPALVFKGTEPLLPDFPTLVDWMLQAPLRKSTRVMGDHFPLAEGKIPGVLSLKEATREAQIALEVQQKHLRHYGELARIPVPLAIHALQSAQTARCTAVLQQKLSQPAFERIEPLLGGGLAVYVYYYPTAPVRANYWGGVGSPQLAEYIKRSLSHEHTIAGWVKLLVRLFYLGYLPYSVRNEGLGACMDPGNAALDGGFCDPDSIIPISTSADDEFFHEAVIQSLAMLQNTVELALGLSMRPDLYPSVESFACRQYLQHMLLSAIGTEQRPGLYMDDRFVRLMTPRSIADIRRCANRKKRAGWYSQFLKQRPSG